jgi:carboxypeptidase Taq
MGLPEEHFGSPLCASASLAIDESQSRFWETIIGHSHAFWEHFLPRLQHEFPEQLASISLDTFYRAVNLIKPSLIRIHADEVTYSLHIILRYEIEKALMDGSLKVKEIPDVWNQKMRDYIGIVPPNNAQGCLQDIHWSMGGIGYFPTYALGNMYGAQFLAAFESTHPTWRREVAAGNLTFVRTWLWENIHRYGKEFSADELCKRVTGKPLSQESYIHYLTQKYSQLYGF